MVTFYSTKVLKYKSFNRFSRFVLIGNNIDGFVNVGIVNFEHFDDLKSRLPNIISNINCIGEWDLKLYQVDGIFKIKRLYDYYVVPRKGKLILTLSYMNIGHNTEIYITDAMIHVRSISEFLEHEEKEEVTETSLEIYEEYTTVLLFEAKTKKSSLNEKIQIENQKFIEIKGEDALNVYKQ